MSMFDIKTTGCLFDCRHGFQCLYCKESKLHLGTHHCASFLGISAKSFLTLGFGCCSGYLECMSSERRKSRVYVLPSLLLAQFLFKKFTLKLLQRRIYRGHSYCCIHLLRGSACNLEKQTNKPVGPSRCPRNL